MQPILLTANVCKSSNCKSKQNTHGPTQTDRKTGVLPPSSLKKSVNWTQARDLYTVDTH